MIAVRQGAILLAAALALTGCAGAPHDKPAAKPRPSTDDTTKVIMKKSPAPKPHTLDIKITGAGEMALTYVIDGKKTSRHITVPWHRSFHLKAVPGGHSWSVTMEQLGGSSHGLVRTDGDVVGDLSSNGGGATQVSGSLT